MEQSFDFKTDGVSIEAGIIRLKDLPAIRSFVDMMVENKAGGRSYSLPSFISNIVDSGGTLGLLAASLSGRNMHPVRYICFDKTVKSNWGLPWHQDRLIALQEKRHVEGFGPWSIKQGVPHVEPPVEFLQDMITLRLHLDDCGPENGPLKVVLGSCYEGRIEVSDVSKIVDRSNTAN